MENVGSILILLLVVGGAIGYIVMLRKGIKARQFTTSLSVHEVREIFEEKVARAGWKIVDDGNPMVAQSSLATGRRQQINLSTQSNSDGTLGVDVRPARIIVKYGFIPTKGHTLRTRMNSFTKAVTARDASVVVGTAALREE